MKSRNICFIIGCFFCVLITSIYTRHIIVFADDLEQEVEEITEEYDQQIEQIEEIEQEEDEEEILHDTMQRITEDPTRDSEDPEDNQIRDNVSPGTQENEEVMTDNNNPMDIMIIFSLGLVAGVMVGHFLTGFIK